MSITLLSIAMIYLCSVYLVRFSHHSSQLFRLLTFSPLEDALNPMPHLVSLFLSLPPFYFFDCNVNERIFTGHFGWEPRSLLNS